MNLVSKFHEFFLLFVILWVHHLKQQLGRHGHNQPCQPDTGCKRDRHPTLYGAKTTNKDKQPDSTYKTTYFEIENICKKQHIPIAAKKENEPKLFDIQKVQYWEMRGEVHNLSNFQEMQHFYGRKRWTSLWNKLATFELDWSYISWPKAIDIRSFSHANEGSSLHVWKAAASLSSCSAQHIKI